MWGGCIEDMQIKRRQQVYMYPLYTIQLFFKSFIMFVALIPSHNYVLVNVMCERQGQLPT